jgi:UDP-2,3-diacylglucosamine pyrophosphatase LpxH
MGKKQIFLSDFHMGPGKKLSPGSFSYEWLTEDMANVCANFLDQVGKDPDVDNVVLMGDVFDNNVCPIDVSPPTYDEIIGAKKNKKLITSIKKLTEKKTVYLLPGNHDIDYDRNEIQNKLFPKINYCNNDEYEDGKIVAIHGNANYMWCAPDYRPANKYAPLPLGYFLSRIGATRKTRCGNKDAPVIKIIGKILKELIADPTQKDLVEELVEYAWKWAKIGANEKVIISKGEVTYQEIIDNYRDLPAYWRDLYKDYSFQDYMFAWQVIFFIEGLKDGKKVFIAGHTHDDEIREDLFKDNIKNGIYANSGLWCSANPHFVETEEDPKKGRLFVRLKAWNNKKSRSQLHIYGEKSIPID